MKRILAVLAMVWTMHTYAQNVPPVFKNFRIEQTQPGRVYFDSNVPVNGSTVSGIVISGKKVSGISLQAGSTNGHYLTVSMPFTFWDNNTIRYEGGSNIESAHGVSLSEFTLQYIENNIPEPTGTGKKYYVATSGSDVQDGLSESKSWRTITHAAKVAKAGDIVYIRAGDYGSEQVVVLNSGTASEPIKFIGYKNTPGDNPKIERSPSTKFISSEMPYIHSKELTGSGLSAAMKEHIIIRNFQVEGYDETVNIRETKYTILDNIYVRGGRVNINDFPKYRSLQNRVINSYTSDAPKGFLTGERHLIDNVYASSYGKPDMDYYIVIVGGSLGLGEHIIRNCTVVRDPSDTHPGHGISLKAQSRPIEYSLVEKSTVTDVGMALEARHSTIRNNVYRDILVTKNGQLIKSLTGIQITSAQKNIFERIHVNGYTFGIKFLGSKEDIYALDAGNSNVIRNCLFTNNEINISILEDLNGNNRVPKNNSIINCTFNNSNSMYSIEANESGTGNSIINTIIGNVKSEFGSYKNPHQFQYNYSNFFSESSNHWSGKAQSGIGNISENPKYENISSGNYRLKADSPVIDKGKNIEHINADFDNRDRPNGKSIDIGAFEYQDKTTGAIKADAGKDQTICSGSSAVLTASGGSNYKWSTGATTKTITVSPKSTTTYSVTVSDGASSGTDEVLVTVNALPVANAGADVSIETGQSTTLTASGGDTYLWSTGETTASITVKPASSMIYEVRVNKNGCESSDSVKVTVKNSSTGSGIVADAGKDVSICSGSSAVLTASGGSVYTWTNGSSGNTIVVSPDKTTIYTVTISDGVNTTTDDVTVEVQALPVANAGADVSIEAGQSTTLTASGGDAYLWSTGETTASITVKPDSSTSYEVTVTSGGCSSTDTVIVSVNGSAPPVNNITADAGQDIVICKGNSAVLTASGGSSYVWSKGERTKSIIVSPEITTTYSVTVFDGVSSHSDDVTVHVTEMPVANAGADVTIEAGQSVVLSAGGGDNYTWNTGETTKEIMVNPLVTTTYEVIVGKNGCESTDKVQVIVKEVPPAAANAGTDITICKGESITLKGDGGATYSWSTGSATREIMVSPTRTTTYTLTANRGGTTNTDEVTVTVINCDLNNGINNSVSVTTGNTDSADTDEQNDAQILNKADFELTVYPNPTEGRVNVQTTVPVYNFNLVLMNINGNVIYSDEMDAREDGINKEIDLSGFAKGVYLLQLYNEEESYVKKVIVI